MGGLKGGSLLKKIFLRPWDEAVGTVVNYRIGTDYITLIMLSSPKYFEVMIPISIVKDGEISLDKLIGNKISVLRTFQGLMLKKEYNSANNNEHHFSRSCGLGALIMVLPRANIVEHDSRDGQITDKKRALQRTPNRNRTCP